MRTCLILIALVFLPGIFFAQKSQLATFFETSSGTKTPRYDETVSYCRQLDKASPLITYTTFGKSPQGRALPLLIADKQGFSNPVDIKTSGRLILMIQACIHAGEPDGKDAGLMLLRDLAIHRLSPGLLDHVSIVFIPIFNVDGHERFGPFNRINQNGPDEMGWRTTAQNLNLNRDYLKADAPEMKAWLTLFDKWLPDFFIDCHVTDGADYQYVLTYALEPHPVQNTALASYVKSNFEPAMVKAMDERGFPVFPYVEFRRWHDPRSGIVDGVAPPMLSQGYVAARNRIGLLIESHMLKPYKQRVEGTYTLIKYVLETLNSDHAEIGKLIREADRYVSSEVFRDHLFSLTFEVSSSDSVLVDFKGVKYTIDSSDLTGGLWFKYDNTQPETFRIPMFNAIKPGESVALPMAYIVPVQYADVIERLRLHGVKIKELQSEQKINVMVTMFSDARWQPRPYEGRNKVTFKTSESMREMLFPKGSALILMNQAAAAVIAHLLEPLSPNSFVSWGFFNAVFEQKEYFETYVMEPFARGMIEKEPSLLHEFELWKSQNPKLAGDPYAQLGWFYSKTSWYDNQHNVYPVVKIYDRATLERIR